MLPLGRGACASRALAGAASRAAAFQGVVLLPPRGAAFCGLAAGLAPPGGPCKAQGRALVRRSKLALAALAALVKSSSAALVVPRTTLLERTVETPLLYEWCAPWPIPGQKPQQDLAGGGERASWGRSDRRVAAVRARSRAAVAACAVVASGLPRRPSGKASSSPLNPSARGGRPRARFEVDAPRRADRAEPPP